MATKMMKGLSICHTGRNWDTEMEERKEQNLTGKNGIKLSVAANEGIRGCEYKLKGNKLPINVTKNIPNCKHNCTLETEGPGSLHPWTNFSSWPFFVQRHCIQVSRSAFCLKKILGSAIQNLGDSVMWFFYGEPTGQFYLCQISIFKPKWLSQLVWLQYKENDNGYHCVRLLFIPWA